MNTRPDPREFLALRIHRIHGWAFDPVCRELSKGDLRRRLSPKAASVLACLAERAGEPCSRELLLDRVWRARIVTEEVLTHAISELRHAFSDDRRTPRVIQTVHRHGYRLVASATSEGPLAMLGDLESQALVLEAENCAERGDPGGTDEAIRLLRRALDSSPALPSAHLGLGRCLLFMDLSRAIDFPAINAHCNAARAAWGDTADIASVEAASSAAEGDYARSAERVRHVLSSPNHGSPALYLAGRAAMASFDLRPAAAMLERCAALAPAEYYPLVLAGKLRRMLDDQDAARANYAKAMQRVARRLAEIPGDARARLAKLRCEVELGLYEDSNFELLDELGKAATTSYQVAGLAARLGHDGMAVSELESFAQAGRGRPWATAWLERDPDFNRLQSERLFRQIVRHVSA